MACEPLTLVVLPTLVLCQLKAYAPLCGFSFFLPLDLFCNGLDTATLLYLATPTVRVNTFQVSKSLHNYVHN